MTAPARAALYLRSRPDGRPITIFPFRTSAASEELLYVSWVGDRRRLRRARRVGDRTISAEFQRMIDAATTNCGSVRHNRRPQLQPLLPRPVSARVLRPAAGQERRAAGVDHPGARQRPMSNMIRQIMALFDEYQSKENAKHTLAAMKENARQGFWKRLPAADRLPHRGRRRAARPPDQEDLGDRSLPSRDRAANLPLGARRRRHVGAAGRQEDHQASQRRASAPETADAGASAPSTRC
jgi:hypothetical protein